MALELELILFGGAAVTVSLGAIDGEGVGDFEGSSVVGAAVVGVALKTKRSCKESE